MLIVELVISNEPDAICRFLTYDDREEDTLEVLEAANELITPLMNYIRECKGTQTFMNANIDSYRTTCLEDSTTLFEKRNWR